MASFMDDFWFLCDEPDAVTHRCKAANRTQIEIRDLPGLPGIPAFSVNFGTGPVGYGYFNPNADPQLITVFFFKPLVDNNGAYTGTIEYYGRVIYDDDAVTPRSSIIKGIKRHFNPNGTKAQADDDWTSNRPVQA